MKPEHPHDAGVPERAADVAHNEGAHLLADEVRVRLEAKGFTWQEILEWAETYLSAEHSGSAETFLQWIEDREQPNG